MNDWTEDDGPQVRDAGELAKKLSISGDYQFVENGYTHDCKEPDDLGWAERCTEAGYEIIINPVPWQLMEGAAKAAGSTAPNLLGQPENWHQDDDVKLSKKWKKPR